MPPLVQLILALAATASCHVYAQDCDVAFGDPHNSNGWYTCSSSCTARTDSAYSQQNRLVGTFTYTADSPVCMSALHAGFLQPGELKNFTVNRSPVNTSFVATIRNRVVSGALTVRPGQTVFGYTITSSDPVSPAETDLSQSELMMIHNNNHQSLLHLYPPLVLACLPNTQGQSLYDDRFYRWNYATFPLKHTDVTALQQTPLGEQIKDRLLHNSRLLRCLGSSPVLDVTGISGHSEEPIYIDVLPEEPIYESATSNDPIYIDVLPEEPIYESATSNESYYVDMHPERPIYEDDLTLSSLRSDARNGSNTTTINTPTALYTSKTLTAHLDDLTTSGAPEGIYDDPPGEPQVNIYEPSDFLHTASHDPLYEPVDDYPIMLSGMDNPSWQNL